MLCRTHRVIVSLSMHFLIHRGVIGKAVGPCKAETQCFCSTSLGPSSPSLLRCVAVCFGPHPATFGWSKEARRKHTGPTKATPAILSAQLGTPRRPSYSFFHLQPTLANYAFMCVCVCSCLRLPIILGFQKIGNPERTPSP